MGSLMKFWLRSVVVCLKLKSFLEVAGRFFVTSFGVMWFVLISGGRRSFAFQRVSFILSLARIGWRKVVVAMLRYVKGGFLFAFFRFSMDWFSLICLFTALVRSLMFGLFGWCRSKVLWLVLMLWASSGFGFV